MGNSVGNTDKDVRKFMREHGMKTNKENVDRISKELRRTEAQNEFQAKIAKEMGLGLRDGQGDVKKRVEAEVREQMRRRDEGR